MGGTIQNRIGFDVTNITKTNTNCSENSLINFQIKTIKPEPWDYGPGGMKRPFPITWWQSQGWVAAV